MEVEVLSTPGDMIMNIFVFYKKMYGIILELYIGCDDTWNCQSNMYYSTGVQIVSCTLSDDSVLSESTGLFNPVLSVSQWNLFWQKN